MEDITQMSKDRKAVGQELLERLNNFEKEDWQIFGWHHMYIEKIKWLAKSQKLADCQSYGMVKAWLSEDRTVVPLRSTPDGLVQYMGEDDSVDKFFVDSIYFGLWLAKGEEICVVSYGEHKFSEEVLERNLGRAGYSIVFLDWKKVIPVILSAQEKKNWQQQDDLEKFKKGPFGEFIRKFHGHGLDDL